MPMREVVVDSGDYKRVNIFPVRRSAHGKRGKRNKPSSEIQSKLNEKNSINHYVELIQENFTPNDFDFDLTYIDGCNPGNSDEARERVVNFIRRIKYHMRKSGLDVSEFKYVYSVHQASSGKFDHHCTVTSGLDKKVLEKLWGWGHCNADYLQFDENGLRGRAWYVARKTVTCKRWYGSQNLSKPRSHQNDYRIGAKDARHIDTHPEDVTYIQNLYPGYSVACVETTANQSLQSAAFLTIYLYKTNNAYFRRNRWGGIDYRYMPPKEKENESGRKRKESVPRDRQ